MNSKFLSIPRYILSAICILSCLVRLLHYNQTTRTYLPDATRSLITFPSPPDLWSTLSAALCDFSSVLLITYERTRFFSSGTVLVLLGMSAGSTLNSFRNEDKNAKGKETGVLEITMFKLMIANLATIAAWKESGSFSGVKPKAKGGTALDRSGKEQTRSTGRQAPSVSVHQRLR